jgi:hypothetical protein
MENENLQNVSGKIEEIIRDKKKMLAEIAQKCEQTVECMVRDNPIEDLQEKIYETKLLLQELSYRLVDYLKDSIEEIESEFYDEPEVKDSMTDMMQSVLIPEIHQLIKDTVGSRLK